MNEKRFLIKKESLIIIYGAAVRGYYYKEKLIRQGFKNIIGFIDVNAKKIEQRDEVPIFDFDALSRLAYNKQDIVVILSLSNRFSHEEIVKKLFELGFENMIYQPYDIDTEDKLQLYRVYESIANINIEEPILEQEIVKYHRLSQNSEVIKVLNQNSDYVTTLVPSDILFGLTETFFELVSIKDEKLCRKIPDKSIYYFNISFELMESFEKGIDENSWEDYLNTYIKVRNNLMRRDANDRSDLENHLSDRYSIYESMDRLLSINHNFFIENPAEVKWNSKGYFNIEDGNNRVSFEVVKGIFMIPCKMTKKDYKTWLNVQTYKKLEKYLLQNNMGEINIPLANPYFCRNYIANGSFVRKNLFHIARWLGKKAVDIYGKKVLILDQTSIYLGQWFARMGAHVQILEEKEIFTGLYELINKLSYLDKNISIRSDILEDSESSFNISILSGNNLEKRFDKEQFIKNIANMTSEIIIIDLEWKSDMEDYILDKTSFEKYIPLKIFPAEGKFRQIGLFLKY